MKRRRFISSMALIIPAVAGSGVFLSSCQSDVKPFDQNDIKLLDEIGEVIIPTTSTSSGAKAAKVGEFMKTYVTDCYSATDQQIFIEGIGKIRKLSEDKYGKEFLKLTISQKQDLLNVLEKQVHEFAQNKQKNKSAAGNGDAIQAGKAPDDKSKIPTASRHYYSMIKDLTLLGYFTSESGATKALRYVQTPGYYKGEVPYKKGDKSWAS
jgi:hypothetical protein